jgi:N-glycosylase/DNA lyase
MSKTTRQRVLRQHGESVEELWLPSAEASVIPGVSWGRFDCLFTPAFWASRMWIDEVPLHNFRLGKSLVEEVVACLLGGYGMAAELGLIAFQRLRSDGLLHAETTSMEIEVALTRPLQFGERTVRYRYPRQKAKYVARALRRLSSECAPTDPLMMRSWLLSFDGIGLKTASWITRNTHACDEVAILDVHIERAGKFMGLFEQRETPQRDYLLMERKLVDFSRGLGLRLSALDDLIWRYMKGLNRTAIECAELRAM